MKSLFIAEKNSVMRKIQDCYNRHKEELIAFLGGEVDFVALSGHLCQWLEPKDYTQWDCKWAERDLPMIPSPFLIKPIPTDYQKAKLAEVKRYVDSGQYGKYIVGTDPDEEGFGRYFLVAKYLKFDDKPTLRFYEQSMTDEEIMAAFKNMTDAYSYPREVQALERFLVRSRFDWISGMSATVGMTVKCGEMMRVSRVKAPTLKLIYDNCMAIENFSKTESYKIQVNYMEGFSGFMLDEAGDEVEKDTINQVQEICDRLTGQNEAQVTNIEKKVIKNNPKRFYKLSSLQVDGGKDGYDYTPTQINEWLQHNYESGFVGYPRCDSETISTGKAKEIPDILNALKKVPELKPIIERITSDDIVSLMNNKKYVNDEETKKANHEALMPTKRVPDIEKLSKGERDVYLLVVKRFLAAFYPPEIKDKTRLWANIDGKTFYSEGSSVKDPGWKALYDISFDEEGETPNPIPDDLQIGDYVFSESFIPYKKIPKPPTRYTESTLIGAMENIAKFIEDEQLKKAMKAGIGTQATRATIIKELIDTKYVESRSPKNMLYITDMGKRYVEKLSPFSIINPEEAARWETVFKSVGEGSISYNDAEKAIFEYCKILLEEIKNTKIEKVLLLDENAKPNGITGGALEGLRCPYCGAEIKRIKFSYVCVNNIKRTCTFSVRHVDGRVKPEDIRQLIETGKTRIIAKVCPGKNGKTYDARLVLNPKDNRFTTGYEFAEKKKESVVKK